MSMVSFWEYSKVSLSERGEGCDFLMMWMRTPNPHVKKLRIFWCQIKAIFSSFAFLVSFLLFSSLDPVIRKEGEDHFTTKCTKKALHLTAPSLFRTT